MAESHTAGGQWTHGEVRGTYRVILAELQPWGSPLRGYVQWLVRDSVVAMAELPDMVQLWDTGELGFIERGNHSHFTIASTKRSKWGRTRWLTFELGAPGEVRKLPD